MTTISTPVADHSEPTPTIEGFEMSQDEFDAVWRNALSVLVKLYYVRYGRRPGYKVKLELKEVREE